MDKLYLYHRIKLLQCLFWLIFASINDLLQCLFLVEIHFHLGIVVMLSVSFFFTQLGYCCMMYDNGRTLPHEGMVTMFVVIVNL